MLGMAMSIRLHQVHKGCYKGEGGKVSTRHTKGNVGVKVTKVQCLHVQGKGTQAYIRAT